MRANFEKALAFLFRPDIEGGYVNDPHDPGGETNMGITDKQDGKIDGKVDVDGDGVGDVAVRNLTREEAAKVYLRNYWGPACCDWLPSGVDTMVFDSAVNIGVHRAVVMLQEAAGVAQDGKVGPATIAAAKKSGVLNKFAELRADYYRTRSGFRRYGDGWLDRTAKCLAASQVLEQA